MRRHGNDAKLVGGEHHAHVRRLRATSEKLGEAGKVVSCLLQTKNNVLLYCSKTSHLQIDYVSAATLAVLAYRRQASYAHSPTSCDEREARCGRQSRILPIANPKTPSHLLIEFSSRYACSTSLSQASIMHHI